MTSASVRRKALAMLVTPEAHGASTMSLSLSDDKMMPPCDSNNIDASSVAPLVNLRLAPASAVKSSSASKSMWRVWLVMSISPDRDLCWSKVAAVQ